MLLSTKLKKFFKFKKSKDKKVLLVDDDAKCLKFHALILNELDKKIDIFTANTGKEALKLIKNKKFDFILLDLGLPDISGIDILKMMKIKKYDLNKVIILTVYDEEYMKIACGKFNAYSFIEKPLDVNKLHKAIS